MNRFTAMPMYWLLIKWCWLMLQNEFVGRVDKRRLVEQDYPTSEYKIVPTASLKFQQ